MNREIQILVKQSRKVLLQKLEAAKHNSIHHPLEICRKQNLTFIKNVEQALQIKKIR